MKRKLIEYDGVLYRSQKHPLYTTWFHMLEKCRNPKVPGYKLFGQLGIKVCTEWSDSENGFKNFVDSIGVKPSKGHGLFRKDDTKDRCKPRSSGRGLTVNIY